jgi:hypothetical protein
MTFDSRTNTIKLKEPGDFLADSGSFFLKLLKDLGGNPGAPTELAADWAIVAGWLGCRDRDLAEADFEKFGLVFRSFLARGIAPSLSLEEPFKKFALMAKAETWSVVPVPQELVPVFERMLANDADIKRKRANDAVRFAAVLKSLTQAQTSPAARTPGTKPASGTTRVNWIPLVASITMLLFAAADTWPYGFYQLLRIVVTGTAGYVAVQLINRHQVWPWIMGGIAILFNPILPISFTREEWQPIDFGVAVLFLIALVQGLRRRL